MHHPLALALAIGTAVFVMNTDLAQSAWRPTYVMTTDLPTETRIVVQFEDDQLSGFGGCNRFYSAYNVSGNTIQIGPLASTRKGCPDTTPMEVRFFAALRAAATFTIDGNTLVLFDAAGVPIVQFVKIES